MDGPSPLGMISQKWTREDGAPGEARDREPSWDMAVAEWNYTFMDVYGKYNLIFIVNGRGYKQIYNISNNIL